jgi:hypothetical protein
MSVLQLFHLVDMSVGCKDCCRQRRLLDEGVPETVGSS